MITTPWDDIDAGTLQSLCDAGAAESGTLDFKRTPPATQRDDISNEVAKDVSALANANGGDIVYGIASINYVADHLEPITNELPDALMRRIREVVDNHIEPRIPGIRFKEVPLNGGAYALVLRVPRSFDGPHLYRHKQRGQGDRQTSHFRFVLRSDTLTQDMDYAQLRDAFGRTASLVEKARAFRAERLSQMIEEGQFLGGMGRDARVCVHLVPLTGIARGSCIDVREVYHRADISFVRPGGYVPQKQTNLDGLLMTGPTNRDANRIDWLVRLFRNGAMEYMEHTVSQDADEDGGRAFIPAVAATETIRRVCAQLLSHARALGLEGPAILGLAGLDIAGHQFRIMRNGGHYGNAIADRAHAVLSDHWIDDLSQSAAIDAQVRPMLDEFWQCFGEVDCELFDRSTGQWVMPQR